MQSHNSHCRGCRPSGTEAAGKPPTPSQDCAVAKAAYAYGLHLQPERAPNRDLFDALELEACGETPPDVRDCMLAHLVRIHSTI